MIDRLAARDRGHANHGWLDTFHSFSFADYWNPERMGFRALRVINDDRIAPATGFGKHAHRDMEIVTIVQAGVLEHQDSLGNVGQLRPGEVQRMSAGSGVMHSEKNPSPDHELHLYQIWILPESKGLPPSWEQKLFAEEERRNRFRPVVAPDGREGALRIHQDAVLSVATFEAGATLAQPLAARRHAWLQVARGRVFLNGIALEVGDGAAVSEESSLAIRAAEASELILFDLA